MRIRRQRFSGGRGNKKRRERPPEDKIRERLFSPPATAEEAQRVILQLLSDWELRMRQALLGTSRLPGRADASVIRERTIQRLAGLGPVALEPLTRLLRAERGTLIECRRAMIAALALGRVGDVRAMSDLLAALRDQREQYAPVRAAVAGVLGQFKAEGAATIYGRTLQNSSSDDWRVDTELLSTIHLETIVEALIEALGDTSAEVRAAAAGAFIDLCLEDTSQAALSSGPLKQDAMLPGDEGQQSALTLLRTAVEPLSKALQDAEASVRVNAATALGWIADPRAAAALARCLGDTDAQCRGAAALALGMLRTSAVLKPLARAMADPSTEVRLRAAEALQELSNPVAIDLLLDVLYDAGEPLEVRSAAARALGSLHLPQVLPALEGLLDAPEPMLRAAAIEALSLLGFGQVYRLLVPFLWHEPDRAVRHAAARAVARLAIGRQWRARWRLRLALRVSPQARQEALLILEQQKSERFRPV